MRTRNIKIKQKKNCKKKLKLVLGSESIAFSKGLLAMTNSATLRVEPWRIQFSYSFSNDKVVPKWQLEDFL